jgi:hypothetical protein
MDLRGRFGLLKILSHHSRAANAENDENFTITKV